MNVIQSFSISSSWLCFEQTTVCPAASAVQKAEESLELLSSCMQQERVAESQEGPGRIGCSCTILTGTAEVFRNDTVLFHLLNNCRLPVSE